MFYPFFGDITKIRKIPDYGDHMTIEEFSETVAIGAFNDNDGHGVLATATEASNLVIYPSSLYALSKFDPDGKWTHVVWFNK